MMKNLENYLIDNEVFLEHIVQKGHVIKHVYNDEFNGLDEIQSHCKYIKDTHNIYIYPYCYLVEESKQKDSFYVFLNYYLGDVGIKQFTDLKTFYDVLCYIFLVQYYFL